MIVEIISGPKTNPSREIMKALTPQQRLGGKTKNIKIDVFFQNLEFPFIIINAESAKIVGIILPLCLKGENQSTANINQRLLLKRISAGRANATSCNLSLLTVFGQLYK